MMQRLRKSGMAVRKKGAAARSWRTRLIPVVAAAAVFAALYLFLFTRSFDVKEVQLFGSRNLPADSLRAITAGLLGRNIFTFHLSGIKERLLGLPEIRDVVFKRRLFNRLDCYVMKRDPVALLAVGNMLEVDAGGVIIPRRSTGDVDLPLITGIGKAELAEPEGRRKMESALEVLKLLKEFGFSPSEQLSEIHIEGDDVMLIWMGTGTLIRVGSGEYIDRLRKLRAVLGILDEYERFPGFIDLRFDHQVVVR